MMPKKISELYADNPINATNLGAIALFEVSVAGLTPFPVSGAITSQDLVYFILNLGASSGLTFSNGDGSLHVDNAFTTDGSGNVVVNSLNVFGGISASSFNGDGSQLGNLQFSNINNSGANGSIPISNGSNLTTDPDLTYSGGVFTAISFVASGGGGFTGSGAGLTDIVGVMSYGIGWSANGDVGDGSGFIPDTATNQTVCDSLDLLTPGAGTLLMLVTQKVKALQASLANFELPNT